MGVDEGNLQVIDVDVILENYPVAIMVFIILKEWLNPSREKN